MDLFDAEKEKEQAEQRRKKKLCAMVREEFERRAVQRRPFELQWQLNMNFMLGNQYYEIASLSGDLYETEREYPWQEREVYNHIAPIMESRLAKLTRVRPQMLVRPATSDEEDVQSAKVCTALVKSCFSRLAMSEKLDEAAMWSEICGTVFYKSVWSDSKGIPVGSDESGQLRQGDIETTVCPPYEIYPDSPGRTDVDRCESIIHARAYSSGEVERIWGIRPEGGKVKVYGISAENGGLMPGSSELEDGVLVTEYYEMPSAEFNKGRLLITCGDILLYEGDLPYKIGEGNERGIPFIRQVSISRPGCFWGISIIERCIPIQRAYNAVKNRKHEFLNRAAVGVLAVEEGSVDLENLELEGLAPGKLLVYRQGTNIPAFLPGGNLPGEFIQEESELLQEFEMISGVSEMMRRSYAGANISSGTALSLLSEQDDTRLSVTAEHIRSAMRSLAKIWLRLYKQFAGSARIDRVVGANGQVSALYWKASQITSDDVVHETENELSQSLSQRRQMIFDLIARGIFTSPQGGLSERTKARLLNMLGLGDWENAADMPEMQMERAQRENFRMSEGEAAAVENYDDHEVHETEHIKFMLSEQYEELSVKKPEWAALFQEHLTAHQILLNGGISNADTLEQGTTRE